MFRKCFTLTIAVIMIFQVVMPAMAINDSLTCPAADVADMEQEINSLYEKLRPYEDECRSTYADRNSYMHAIYDFVAAYEDVNSVTWDDDDTFTFTMSKGMRAVYDYDESTMRFSETEIISEKKAYTYRVQKGAATGATDAVMFGPFYGIQSEFESYEEQYQNVCTNAAEKLGGTAYIITGREATPETIREYGARDTNAIVIFSGHGMMVDGCSYINAYGREGITADDILSKDALSSANHPGYYLINGNFITKGRTAHLSVDCIWWFAACEGMMTDGLYAPLLGCGAGCVFGYSRSVTFLYEIDFSAPFWEKYISGSTVKDAAAYAKRVAGAYDHYYYESAHPVFMSPQDTYPVSNTIKQDVKCDMTLYGYTSMYKVHTVTFESDESGFTADGIPQTATVTAGDVYTLPIDVPQRVRDAHPELSAGEFSGWRMTADDSMHMPGESLIMPDEDVIFEAVWENVCFMLTYTGFDGDDITQVYASGMTVTTEQARESDAAHVFCGWLADNDGMIYTAGCEFVMPYCDVVLTAQYADRYLTVIFADSDDSVIDSQSVIYGAAAIPPEAPVHDGYVFIGWDRDFSCITEDMTIKAVYEEEKPQYLLGDVNNNGLVNTADSVYILKAAAGMLTLEDAQVQAADCNRDGNVNTADAALILKYAAGLINGFSDTLR